MLSTLLNGPNTLGSTFSTKPTIRIYRTMSFILFRRKPKIREYINTSNTPNRLFENIK